MLDAQRFRGRRPRLIDQRPFGDSEVLGVYQNPLPHGVIEADYSAIQDMHGKGSRQSERISARRAVGLPVRPVGISAPTIIPYAFPRR